MFTDISFLGSLASIILFIIYVIGRGITIITVKRLWRDKIYTGYRDYDEFNIIDSVTIKDCAFQRETVQGVLESKEGIRNLKIFSVKEDKNGIPCIKDKLVFKKDFLNIDEAIAFYIEVGDLFPTLFVEYEAYDYMKINIEWRENLINGVNSERIIPKHTLKSFLYYFCK